MQAAERLATYDDLLAVPEDVRAEVLAGQVHVAPAPLPRHARAQGALRRFVGGPYDDDDGHGGPGGWWILLEVDVRLGPHDIVRPDLAGWRRPRLESPWDVRPIEVVPDWVCEVLSPSTARRDRLDKAQLYRESGVGALWLVDPEARVLEAFRLAGCGSWLSDGSRSATGRDSRGADAKMLEHLGGANPREARPVPPAEAPKWDCRNLPESGRWVETARGGDGDVLRVAPFEAIELDVGRLFPPLPRVDD